MEVTITDIRLPQQNGCQHIHVDVEYPDGSKESLSYHLTDFTNEAVDKSDDLIHTAIKEAMVVKNLEVSKITRDDFKTEVLGSSLVIKDQVDKLEPVIVEGELDPVNSGK